MPPKNLMVVVVDGLHAGMVGAYGNSWIHTRHLDRLACESFLFDQAYVENPSIDAFYRGSWFGRAASTSSASQPSLIEAIANSGRHTLLVADDPQVIESPLSRGFEQKRLVSSDGQVAAADDLADTQLARLFASAGETLGSMPHPFCLWVHSRGMYGPWDAPREFRVSYADEEDPEPPALVAPPNELSPRPLDPDVILGITHAYAGQVAALDRCVGGLMDVVKQASLDQNTAIILLSARGFPLGEHRRFGLADEALYNELTQLVWMMRFPDGLGRLDRTGALVQPSDLPATIADWFEMPRSHGTSLLELCRNESSSLRDHIVLSSASDRAIRTPAWLLRQATSERPELYTKPSDRWEVNEVAKLCPEIVSGLQAVLAAAERTGDPEHKLPLAEALTTIQD